MASLMLVSIVLPEFFFRTWFRDEVSINTGFTGVRMHEFEGESTKARFASYQKEMLHDASVSSGQVATRIPDKSGMASAA